MRKEKEYVGQEALFPVFLIEGTRTITEKVLVWGEDVASRVEKRAKYQSSRYRASQEEREDFIQECLALVFRKCREQKVQGYAAIESIVANFAIDFFVRKRSREPLRIQGEDGESIVERESDEKTSADHFLMLVMEDFPLLACVTILIGEGATMDTIATAFGWDTEQLTRAYESDRASANKAYVSRP